MTLSPHAAAFTRARADFEGRVCTLHWHLLHGDTRARDQAHHDLLDALFEYERAADVLARAPEAAEWREKGVPVEAIRAGGKA